MAVGNNPCWHCANRELGCHGSCALYAEWKNKHDEVREADRKEREINRIIGNYIFVKGNTGKWQKKKV